MKLCVLVRNNFTYRGGSICGVLRRLDCLDVDRYSHDVDDRCRVQQQTGIPALP